MKKFALLVLCLTFGASAFAAIPGFQPGKGRSIAISKSSITCNDDFGAYPILEFAGLKEINFEYGKICEGPYLGQIGFLMESGVRYSFAATGETSPWAAETYMMTGIDGGHMSIQLEEGKTRAVFMDQEHSGISVRTAVEISFWETDSGLHLYLREYTEVKP